MAANSLREQIIVHVVDLVEDVSSIKTVVRVKQSYSDLQQFAVTQLPLAAVVGQLPRPVPAGGRLGSHKSTRSCMDVFISDLPVDIYVYGQELDNPDTLVSILADDIWAKLYEDQYMGGLVISVWVSFEEQLEYWHPYVAFKATVTVKYKHTTGGI